MRKLITLLALVALAACESATGAERRAADAPASLARSAGGASITTSSTHRAAIASVRRRVQGTPGLYVARGLAVDGGEVTVEVRSSTTAFLNLTSGTLENTSTGTGAQEVQFQSAAGTRYLVVAYPSSGGTVYPAGAAFMEAVP